MKYIDGDRLKAQIDIQIKCIENSYDPSPWGTQVQCIASAVMKCLGLVKDIIDEMKQEKPTPPCIEIESRKKGWLDYGSMISEIELQRYNAIQQIKKHRGQFTPQTISDIYHVSEYYKALGSEITCSCLQAYGKDFMFTRDEVKELIKKEG